MAKVTEMQECTGQLKNYEVTLTKVMDTITIKADSPQLTKRLAQEMVQYSEWEAIAEEIEEDN